MAYYQPQSKRYWSNRSRSPMFSRFSISFLMPLIQDCASSADSATRSRLPLRPRKTSVKHRSAGNSSAMLSRTSDWWPSRIVSTSLTETAHKDKGWKTLPTQVQARQLSWVIIRDSSNLSRLPFDFVDILVLSKRLGQYLGHCSYYDSHAILNDSRGPLVSEFFMSMHPYTWSGCCQPSWTCTR